MKRLLRFVAVVLSFSLSTAGAAATVRSHPSFDPYRSMELKPPPEAASGVKATFFGVTTILLDDGKSSILVDGFFTRPNARSLLVGQLSSSDELVDYAFKRGSIQNVAAVLVSHTHVDHALDSAQVAKRTGAILVGSTSAQNIATGAGLDPALVHIASPTAITTISPAGSAFTIDVIPGKHSPNGLFPGTIRSPLHTPARSRAFRDGDSFSFVIRHGQHAVLVHPSANFVPGALSGVKADVVFLSVAQLGKQTREFARDYWEEVVAASGAKLVIPVHWDDFTLSIKEPLKPAPLIMDKFDRGMKLLLEQAQAHKIPVRFMAPFEPIDIFSVQP